MLSENYVIHGSHVNKSQMKSKISNTLRLYPFYCAAPAELQKDIACAATRLHLSAGRHLVRKGGICKDVIFIGKGWLRIFLDGETAREITLYRIGPGEVCPGNLFCALLDHRAPANACVETDLEAVTVPAKKFRRWVAEHPVVHQFVFQALAERQDALLGRVEELVFQSIDHRLADYLLRNAVHDSGRSTIRATHEQIARDLGSAREVITRTLKTFERSGAVALARGQIALCDPGFLQSRIKSQSQLV